MSILTKDLNTVAGIVGSLGLSIAAAQRAMNLDYLDSLDRLASLAIALQHGNKLKADGTAADAAAQVTDADRAFAQALLTKCAPTRYQYTKTTLEVRLDLAQTSNSSLGLTAGVALGATAVNASFARSTGTQYQAAAQCTTVIDAIPAEADIEFFANLGKLAAESSRTSLPLPARATELDKLTNEASASIVEKLLAYKPIASTTPTNP